LSTACVTGTASTDRAADADPGRVADPGSRSEPDASSRTEPDAFMSTEPDAGTHAGSAVDSGTGGATPPLDECTLADPNWVFCDAFESGGIWDGSVPVPTLVSEPGPFSHTGNHAAQFRSGMRLWKDLSPELEVAYLRYYVKWEPGHDLSTPRHGPGGFWGGDTSCVGCGSGHRSTDDFHVILENITRSPYTIQAYTYSPGQYMDCGDPNGRCWGDQYPCTSGSSYCTNPEHAARGDEPGMETGRWYCMEQMIDVGTPTSTRDGADGVLNFWIDNQEIGPWTDMWWRTSSDVKINSIWLLLYHHAEHTEEGLLIDNVVASRERIGCPSSP